MNEELEVAGKKLGMLKGVPHPPITIGVYAWGWSQYLLGFAALITSYLNLEQTWPGCLWGIPLGWGIYAVWMCGHDACHDSIFFSTNKMANKIVTFLCLDCLVITGKNWVRFHHKEHHIYPNSNVDGQRLRGDYLVAEIWWLGVLLMKYIVQDLVDLFSFKSEFHFLVAFPLNMWRLYFLLSLGPIGLPVTLISLLNILALMGLLTHSNQLQIPSTGWRQRQLQNTCDFLPGSWLAECFSGGLNTHGVHHCLPSLPRGLHGWASEELRKLEPEHYRGYSSVIEVAKFWWNRIDPPPLSGCPGTKDYYDGEGVLQGRTDVEYTHPVYHYNKTEKEE